MTGEESSYCNNFLVFNLIVPSGIISSMKKSIKKKNPNDKIVIKEFRKYGKKLKFNKPF